MKIARALGALSVESDRSGDRMTAPSAFQHVTKHRHIDFSGLS